MVFEWLVDLSNFLNAHQITPHMLIFFAGIVFIAFILCLREFMAWFTKTPRILKELKTITDSQKQLEQKLDYMMTLKLHESQNPPSPDTNGDKQKEAHDPMDHLDSRSRFHH